MDRNHLHLYGWRADVMDDKARMAQMLQGAPTSPHAFARAPVPARQGQRANSPAQGIPYSDIARGVMDYVQQNPADTAFMAGSMLPVVGDAVGLTGDVLNMYQNPDQRTWGNVAMAAAGALPFVPSGMGQAVRAADKMTEAQRLAVQGGALTSKPNLRRIASAFEDHSYINRNPMDLRPQERNGLYYYFDDKTGGIAAEEWAKGERLSRKTFNEQSTLKTLRDWLGY